MENLQGIGSPMRELHDRFAALTEPIRPALWRYCLRLTGSAWDAEDLVQESLIRAFGRLRQYWQPLEPRSYLFRIATNAWIDTQRRARLLTAELDDAAALGEQGVDPAERWAAMERLVTILPPRQRVVLLLIDVFEFTAQEVAGMINATEGAVKAALHRARTSLAARSGEAGERVGSGMTPAPSPLIQRYLDAFNRRDPEGIASLLHAEATADVVGVAEEVGREVIRQSSLRETFLDPRAMRALFGHFEGEPVVGILYETAPGVRGLGWVIRIDEEAGEILRMRHYYYTPELIARCAEAWGLPPIDNGYRYIPSA